MPKQATSLPLSLSPHRPGFRFTAGSTERCAPQFWKDESLPGRGFPPPVISRANTNSHVQPSLLYLSN